MQFYRFSSITSVEICVRAGLDIDQSTASLDETGINSLKSEFFKLISDIKNERFEPVIISDYETEKPLEYSAFHLVSYNDKNQ